MSSDLVGRDLEIAVATALGWTVTHETGDLWNLRRPNGDSHLAGSTERDAWDRARLYLTDPAAFADVLAALDGSGLSWDMGWREDVGRYAAIRPASDADWLQRTGKTYQEASCRLFVAWKEDE